MAREPITIFAARIDPDGVRREILAQHPDVEVDGRGARCSRITVAFGTGKKARSIPFRHNPEYYGGDNWVEQMNGMKGYFIRFPGGNRVPRVLGLIGTFKFALATEFQPDFDPDDDPRFSVL